MNSQKNELTQNIVQKDTNKPSSFQAKHTSSDVVRMLVSEPWTGYLEVA